MEITETKIRKFSILFLEAIVFTIIIIVITRSLSIYTPLSFPIALIVFSIPIAIYNFYKISMIKKMHLSKFHSRGSLYRFMSRRTFRYIFWICFSPVISGYALIKLYGFSIKEWLILFLIIPIFKLVFNIIRLHIKKEIKEEYVNIYTLRYAVIISSAIMAVLFPLLVYLSGEYDISSIMSIDDAVKLQLNDYIQLKSSPVAYAIASKVAFFNGLVIYFLSLLSGKLLFFAILVVAGEGFVFFSLMSIFALYLLRKQELSKIYYPLSDKTEEEGSKKVSLIRPISSTLILLFLFIFGYLYLKDNLKNNKDLIRVLELPQEIVVDIVDAQYLTAGTIIKLQKLKTTMKKDIDAEINWKIDIAFDMMVNNVDGYLDWYYGLTAEYFRTIKFITGGLENFMKEKLKEYLQKGDLNSIISRTLNEIPIIIKKTKKEFDFLAKDIIKTNIVKLKPFDSISVNQKASIKSLIKVFSNVEDKIPFRIRAGVSIAGGLITGLIVKRIITKSAYRLSIKLLSKLLGKKLFSRWAGTSAGAAIGAGIGSTVPIAGTAIGGIIGASIGFITSIFIDYSVLKLEEELNRHIYKNQIIKSINRSRMEFKKWSL